MKILSATKIKEYGTWDGAKERLCFSVWEIDRLLQAQAELTREELEWSKTNYHDVRKFYPNDIHE